MENQLVDKSEDIRDYTIDQLHQLVEMGDYAKACSVYEEFRDVILSTNRSTIIYKS